MTLADEAEATAQARQTVELREGARDDQVVVFVHQGCDVVGIAGDETSVSLVDEHHRIAGDILHDTANLLAAQTVARGVVR